MKYYKKSNLKACTHGIHEKNLPVNYYAIRRNLKSEEMVQEWPIQREGKN